MKAFIIALILSISCASALQIIDTAGAPIPDSYVLMKLYSGDTIYEVKGSTTNGDFALDVPQGQYDAGIYVDNLATPGKDYYADTDIMPETKTVRVFPVGSLNGRVVYDNIVASDARLTFDCDKDYGLAYPSKTDKLGYFSIAYIPVGACRINAKLGNKYNYVNVDVKEGQTNEILIELDKELEYNYAAIILIVAAILAIIGIIFYRRPKHRKMSTEETQAAIKVMRMTDEKTVQKIMKEKKDILTTLNKDEKAIVEYLIKHKFKATQPQISKETEIPKTTLARQIISLTNKNIVETRRVRKIKEVKLTDWFLK